ncbi:MAG TPA: CPBP family intramembrane glutamic endopeptidase [Polyangiaceae bacterium]
MIWEPSQRRRQAVVFIAAVLAVSFAYEGLMIRRGGLGSTGALGALGLMWLPAVVSLVLRLAGREGLRDVGWRLGPGRGWLAAYLVPAGCAASTYGLAWLVGGVHFAPPPPHAGSHLGPAVRWLVAIAVNGTLGVLIGAVFALGEELGWRGYLVPRLVAGKVARPLLVSGVVWGLWHVPLILWGGYATSARPWMSALLFLAVIVPAGVFFGWLRLATGSVWPAVLAHAVHNAWYQNIFAAWFGGRFAPWVAGEQGAFSILAYSLTALWLWQSGRLERVSRGFVLAAAQAQKLPTRPA